MMRRAVVPLAAVLCLALFCAPPAAAADYRQWTFKPKGSTLHLPKRPETVLEKGMNTQLKQMQRQQRRNGAKRLPDGDSRTAGQETPSVKNKKTFSRPYARRGGKNRAAAPTFNN